LNLFITSDIDTKMNADGARLKPHFVTLRLWQRLRHFRNAEHAGVEAPRRLFTADRHGELGVMDSVMAISATDVS